MNEKNSIHSLKKKVKGTYKPKSKKISLFVYGTLTNKHYLELLLHRTVKTSTAILYHYMKMISSHNFPFIVPQHGAKVEGQLLEEITAEELKILDNFEDEGNMYNRVSAVVRLGKSRRRCKMYIGNISVLNSNIAENFQFQDRFNLYVEKKIDLIMSEVPINKPGLDKRVLHELMGSAVDSIIQSHFDGNYICSHIMIQALEEAAPPRLFKTLENKELLPYAGNYMQLACQHIVFNQFVNRVNHEYPKAVRVSEQYFHHGIAILLGFMFYNKHAKSINRQFREIKIKKMIPGRGYREYAKIAIDIADIEYDTNEMKELIDFINNRWYSSSTPLGAELEFSNLGVNAVKANPGDDPIYDGFQWFWDFDMFHRTWQIGGHIDSHRQISIGQKRHRGFLEYAFGRYQIIGDLSRPLFDSPWAMSLLINEAVKFLKIKPHSLHISMELGGEHKHISGKSHNTNDLVCLLLLGGDIKKNEMGQWQECRIVNNELDTNFNESLNFSDRKRHFAKYDQAPEDAADVMEFKFMRLHDKKFDYEILIYALKGYQLHTHTKPINLQKNSQNELPEQTFLRKWATKAEAIDELAITNFIDKVKKGLIEEEGPSKSYSYIYTICRKIKKRLIKQNNLLKT